MGDGAFAASTPRRALRPTLGPRRIIPCLVITHTCCCVLGALNLVLHVLAAERHGHIVQSGWSGGSHYVKPLEDDEVQETPTTFVDYPCEESEGSNPLSCAVRCEEPTTRVCSRARQACEKSSQCARVRLSSSGDWGTLKRSTKTELGWSVGAVYAAMPLLTWHAEPSAGARSAASSVIRQSINTTVLELLRSDCGHESPLLHTRGVACTELGRGDVLVFSHIPKCAGSSFFQMLQTVHMMSSSHANCQWFPPKTLELHGDAPIERDSYVAPGCAGNENRAGVHCSVSELASCVQTGLAEAAWPVIRLPPSAAWLGPRLEGKGNVAGSIANVTAGGGGKNVAVGDHHETVRSPLVDAALHRPLGRRPIFVSVLREPVSRTLSEFLWGRARWCGKAVERIDPAWWPWPAALCEAAVNGSRLTVFRRWLSHPENPAHNRQVSHLAAQLAAPAVERERYCIFSHSRWTQEWNRSSSTASHVARTTRADRPTDRRQDSSARALLATDRRALERAWCVLRREHWFVGVLGNGHGVEHSVAIFEYLLGLPVTARNPLPQAWLERGQEWQSKLRKSVGATDPAMRHMAKAFRRSPENPHSSGAPEHVGSGQMTFELAVEIAASNQADVALFEAMRSEFERVLAKALEARRLQGGQEAGANGSRA